MPRILDLIALSAIVAGATAQAAIVLPTGTATSAGNTSNAFPWGWSAAGYGGLRHQGVYSAANFTGQSVNYPVLITRLRWRPNDGIGSFSGGTFAQASIALSTAAVAHTAVTTTWASNHGPDYAVCYTGPVTHAAGNGGPSGTPAPWSVDVPLTTPFPYDPGQGDLIIDVDYPGGSNYSGGTLPSMDVENSSQAARVWGSTFYPNANGAWQNHGVVVEVTYLPAGPNVAFASSYGEGCYDRFASFYETFLAGTFDLANQTLALLPSGSGYVVVPGAPSWHTPTSPPLTLGNNAVSAALPLGFALSYPGGSTQAVFVSSNGFVWAQSNTAAGCCNGNSAELLSQAARWSPLWTDLSPLTGGAIHFDLDPANNAAYVTFLNVRESNSASTNTFQIALFASGQIDYRYQQCAVSAHAALTGWSPGGGARDPGGTDLSTALPVITEPDTHPLSLAAGSRPIVNTGVVLTVNEVPVGSPLGALVGGISQHDPGLNLFNLGMPDCFQHTSNDAVLVLIPNNGTATTTFNVPNTPSLNGLHIYMQAAVLASGANTLGALSSNGLDLQIGTQ